MRAVASASGSCSADRRIEHGHRRQLPDASAGAASRRASSSGDHTVCTAHWNRDADPGPPLADADQLALAAASPHPGRLRRSTPAGTTPSTPSAPGGPRRRRPRARRARGDRPLAEPDHRRRDVVTDARVVQLRRRHDDVEPHDPARLEEDDTAPAAAPDHLHAGRGAGGGVEHLLAPGSSRARPPADRRRTPRSAGVTGSGSGSRVETRRRPALADQPHRQRPRRGRASRPRAPAPR